MHACNAASVTCWLLLLSAVAALGFSLDVIMSAGRVLPVLAIRNLPDVQRSSRQGDLRSNPAGCDTAQ